MNQQPISVEKYPHGSNTARRIAGQSAAVPIQSPFEKADHIVAGLLAAGKVEAAMDAYDRFPCSPGVLQGFARNMFSSRARGALASFLLGKSEELDPKSLSVVLRNIVGLAESEGQVLVVKDALLKLDSHLKRIAANEGNQFDDKTKAVACDVALSVFMIEHAQRIAGTISDEVHRKRIGDLLGRYEQACSLSRVDPGELPYATRAMMSGDRWRVQRPTVVVRVTPRLWQAIAQEIQPQNLPDGLANAKVLNDAGYYVRLAPQYSMPGPSLYAPFSKEQAHPIAFVDIHKYSKGGPFVHQKSTHNRRLLIDRLGYSGWAEIQAAPEHHPFESRDLQDAKVYCDKVRRETFGHNIQRPAEFAEYGRYAVVPLQMPGDSVQRLSPFPFYAMIDACIRFFGARDINVVLRRHPQCKDAELSDYLQSVEKRSGVFISQHKTQDLILHAEAVALCNSSVGWDAVLAHKPLICFGVAEYSRVAHQIFEISDLDEIDDLSSIVSPDRSDLFFSYFWREYAVRGFRSINAKTVRMVQKVLDEYPTSNGVRNESATEGGDYGRSVTASIRA